MKQKVKIVSITFFLFASLISFATAGDLDGRGSVRHCNPAGTWFDDAAPGYLATIVPIQDNNRFSIVFQGNYNPGDLSLVFPVPEFETMTDWTGEMVWGKGGYNAAAIAIFGPAGFPHWPPETWGVKGRMEFVDDCNTIQATWYGCIYAWIWDAASPNTPPPIPWVDEADYYPYGDDCEALHETYHRMIMPSVSTGNYNK